MLKKKSLGQHFLKSAAYLRAVADAGHIERGETVLEVGPGDGALTSELLARGARVVAVEKDRRLVPLLRERFAGQALRPGSGQGVEIIEGDVLRLDISSHVPKRGPHGTYKVVANIPYYITGALLKKFLSVRPQPSAIVFLVQKEVAERIVTSNPDARRSGPRPGRRGKESILSLSVKAYGTPKYLKTVPRGAFAPPPKVDSAILSICDISRRNFADAAHERRFFELLHAGFGHKRKLLRRNLEASLGADGAARMEGAGIPLNARAEDVPLERWLMLSD